MTFTIGSLAVELCSPDELPWAPRVIVLEEDTFTVLSAPPIVPEVEEHPIRVMTGVIEAQPKPVGAILERGRAWLAIVHDLEIEPSTNSDQIRAMINALLDKAEREDLESIALPILGVRYGPMSLEAATSLLGETLAARWFHRVRRVLVLVRSDDLAPVKIGLATFAQPG